MVGCALKRGMRAPELAVGDGALGFWGALRNVFPETRCQRDWVHKTMNVLDRMPKNVHRRAKAAIHEITQAEGRTEARPALKAFSEEFGVKWPKPTAKIEDDEEALLAFYDFPAEHWAHLRTTNPIESTFATVRLRHRRTKGNGSRTACLTMVFKLMQSAAKKWRLLNGSQHLNDV